MTMEEKMKFKEFNISEIDSRWCRMKWIKDLERKYGLEQNRSVPRHSHIFYWDSTLSYVYKRFFTSLLSICSAIEGFFFSYKIPFKKNLFLSTVLIDKYFLAY